QIGADLEERRPPLAVVDVEVVVIDRDGLARKVEGDLRPGPRALLRLERAHFLLRHANDDDALATCDAPAIVGDDVVLPLLRLKVDQGDAMPLRKHGDGRHKTIMEGLEERRGWDRVAQ